MSAADDRAAFEAWWDGDVPSTFEPYDIGFKGQAWAAWQAAIAAEREAAAKVCEAAQDGMDDSPGSIGAWCRTTLNRVAAAIRARGAS